MNDGDENCEDDEIGFDDLFGIAIVNDPEADKQDQKFCSYFLLFGIIIPTLLGLISATIIELIKVNAAQEKLHK